MVLSETQSQEKKSVNELTQLLQTDWFKMTFASIMDVDRRQEDAEKNRSEDFNDGESEKPRLREPTLPIEQLNDPWYDTIEIGYAWLTGFRPSLFWPNTTNCFDRMTNYTYHELPAIRQVLENDTISDYDKTEATLFVVRNVSSHLWYCNSAYTGMNRYFYNRYFEFTGFGHVFLSMLQNFLGNVISLSNLYLSIEENMALNNTYGVHYDSARLIRILVIFDPIELVNDDLTYNPAYNDPDLIPDPDVNKEVVPAALRRTGGHRADTDWGPLVRILDFYAPSSLQQGPSLPVRKSQVNEDLPNPRLFLDLEHKQKGEWGDFTDVRSVFEVILGAANATQITFGANRTLCQFAGEDLWYSAGMGNELISRDFFSYFDMLAAIDAYLYVPYNLYAIQFSCTASVDEISSLVNKYTVFTLDFDIIWFNLFYNAGTIMKGVTNIIMYWVAKDYTRVDSPFSLGMELGQIFWLIFYPAEEYLDDALEHGAVWGQDYTWD